MHLTSWPTPAEIPGLTPVLDRLHSLLPSPGIQTHLLHLASNGRILPHVDNVSASGSWILGVSLGADRVLRLENCSNSDEAMEFLLPSGSVYIQRYATVPCLSNLRPFFPYRDAVRYQYKHSILNERALGDAGSNVTGGQRISVMIRVRSSLRRK